jgi:hypothetical protein
MSDTFRASFLAFLSSGLNDTNVTVSWGRAPQGAPVPGRTDVVIFNAPGGERQSTHSGVTAEITRKIQFSVFSVDPQDVADVTKALHAIVDGARTTLSSGAKINNVTPGMQDIDQFDNEEKVHQTVFDVDVHVSE